LSEYLRFTSILIFQIVDIQDDIFLFDLFRMTIDFHDFCLTVHHQLGKVRGGSNMTGTDLYCLHTN